MSQLTKISETVSEGSEYHEFDAVDSKGRKIGARVHFSVVVFADLPADARGGYGMKAGTYFAWVGNATRNGEHFGAIQPRHYCETEQERAQAVAKYLKGAEKRAAKVA